MLEFFENLSKEFDLPLRNPVLIFSLLLFIILLSPVLRRINIPGIIGLIISGVVIGPNGLNILAQNSAIELFSTIGLLYIMFIAGLELDLNEFKAYKNKSIVFGFFTFILPLSIGFPVCYYFLQYDFNASFLTASMFATHTLVTYPIVSKLGIAKNKAVAVTVGGTILTDTAVLLILAVIMENSQGNLGGGFWIRLGVSLAIFTAIMFLLVPRVAKWFFKKLESEKHSHYIFVLSVVFFAAFLAEVAGVEPIIGAFVAGLALNRLIPHSSALMNRIEFIGNSLFIPFFLISVGMLVDIRVLLKGSGALIIATTLTVVALAGKWLAALLTQLIFRFTGSQRQLIFGLSSAHAAATLAVILVGYKANILDENILNGTIILILITCIAASFATEKAARKIILEDTYDAPELGRVNNILNNEHILVATNNITNMEKLLEFATLIKEKKSANPISILSVVSNNQEAEINIQKSRNRLENIVRQASASDTKVNIVTAIDFNAASGIVRTSREIMADMIILGWPQRVNIIDKLLGEKIETIIGNSDKTLFICHFTAPLPVHKRIMVIAPPLSEKEMGFHTWILKITRLAQELSVQLVFFCNEQTDTAIRKEMREQKLYLNIQTSLFHDWEDFLIISRNVQPEDIFILVSARKGSISHFSYLDSLPAKMEKHFAAHSKIVVYPRQYSEGYDTDGYDELTSGPLNKGIETVQKLGKDIGNIFKRTPEE